MATEVDPHIDDEVLEKYSMGGLSHKAAALVEEHLLICERCRQSLSATDAHIAAMRRAAEKLRRAGQKLKSKGRKAGGNG